MVLLAKKLPCMQNANIMKQSISSKINNLLYIYITQHLNLHDMSLLKDMASLRAQTVLYVVVAPR